MTLVLSEVFAQRRVLAAFFSFCGTLVRKEQEMGLFLIAADNQWVAREGFMEAG